MSAPLDRCAIDGAAPCPDVRWCPCRRPAPPAPLVCAGRPVDDAGQATGEPCGRTLRPREGETAAALTERARAAGWSVAGPAMCPSCRKPDPAITRGLTTNPKEQ